MNKEIVVRLAQKAGLGPVTISALQYHDNRLGKFAELVSQYAKAEAYEECAQIVETEAMQYAEPTWALRIIDRIRAKGNP